MKGFYHLLCGMVITGASVVPVHGQTVRSSNGSVTTLTQIRPNKKAVKSLVGGVIGSVRTDYVKSSNDYFVVAFATLPNASQQAVVKSKATYVTYLPVNMFIFCSADAEDGIEAITKGLPSGLTITGAGALSPQFKMSDEIYALSSAGAEATDRIKSNGIIVSTYQAADLQALTATLDKWGATYTGDTPNSVKVTGADMALITSLAAISYVNGLSVYDKPEDAAEKSMMYMMQPNGIEIVNYDRLGPIGTGVYFANWELYGAEDYYPINTAGRNVEGLTDASENSHGTDCGLIVSGANNTNEYQSQGMAPGVQNLAANDVVNPYGSFTGSIANLINAGYAPLVSNHSVGWARRVDEYSSTAQLVDRNIYNYNNYMCCYPTGNWATTGSGYGIYSGLAYDYGSITGDIKTNKNGIAVHSTIYPSVDVMWANYGPTKDGRMKPEICAQGSGGTSYASPAVAGLFAVLMEQFKTSYPTKSMYVDVCKAVMLNTATDVRTYINEVEGSYGIDYRTGFGQINSSAAVASIKDGRIDFENTVTQDAVYEKSLTLPAGQTELRVMLYWNDPEAAINASTTLINDLDLVVVTPSGEEILPWTLNPSADSVDLPATRTANHRDNVEQVVITAESKSATLEAGEYKIRVKGYAVTQEQRFVLTWQQRERGINLTSLPEGYRLAPGQDVILTWDLTLPSDEEKLATNFTQGSMTPTVYYRTSETAEWTQATAASGTKYWYATSSYRTGQIYGKDFFKFTVPNAMTATSQLQFRIVADDLEAISNKVTVAERMTKRPTITGLTPDSVSLTWPAATGVTSGKYLIYAMTDKYMEVVDSVNLPDTAKTIMAPTGKQWAQDDLFAVAVYDATASALGQRTPPVGLNALNTEMTDTDDQWSSSYLLCMTDTLDLSANKLAGTVQWYRDSAAVASADGGNDRTLRIPSTKPGSYYYTIAVDGYSTPVYSSVSTTINEASLNLADTATWGHYAWKGYVFRDPNGDPSGTTILKDGLGLYGEFDLAPLDFVSTDTLFSVTNKEMAQAINGYVGCDFTTGQYNEQVFVMKRKGFVPGKYTFTLSAIKGRVLLNFYDGSGNTIATKLSGVNSTSEASMVVELDANSSAEIQWIGSTMTLGVSTYLTGISDPVPGNVRSSLGFWLSPDSIAGSDGDYVTELFHTYPYVETLTTTNAKTAKINRTGSNYNSTLDLQGVGYFEGGMTAYNSNAVTDIYVLKPTNTGAWCRFISYGAYESDQDSDNSLSYVAAETNSSGAYLTAMRNAQSVSQTTAKSGVTSLVTLRQNASETSMLVNGSTVAGSGTVSGTVFKLQRVALGGTWSTTAGSVYGTGSLAEVLHYNRKLSTTEENRVRSMLAVKHGITLDHNYISSTAKTVYDVSDGYGYEIVGIGRDDKVALNQRQSVGMTTSGASGKLIMSLGELAETNSANTGAFENNVSYYIAGTNNKTARGRYSGTYIGLNEWKLSKSSTGSETLNLYLNPSQLRIANYTPFLEVSRGKAFTSNAEQGVDTEILTLSEMVAPDGVTYVTTALTPTDSTTYLRVVWQPTTGVASVTADAADAALVTYDASASAFVIDVVGAKTLVVVDGGGRLVQTADLQSDNCTVPTTLAPGIYVVSVKREAKADYSTKLSIGAK